MSGFVANGTADAFELENDGFFPNIDANALRDAMRIEAGVTNARLETSAVAGMLAANRDLAVRRAELRAQGYNTLADVPADRVAGASVLVHAYKRAVYAFTAAEIAERYRTWDATNSGRQGAEQELPTADDYRRDARHALRDILGIGHATVELI